MAEITARFDSLAEFVEQAFKPERNHGIVKTFAAENRGDWYGLANKNAKADHVRNAINNGWLEGADKIANFAGQLEVPKLSSVRRRPKWCDQGDSVDMDRVRAGQLDQAWRRTTRQLGGQPPRIVIAVDSIASGGKDADQMFWQGAAAAALGDALVAAGYVVKCISGFRGRNGCGDTMDVQVTVKEYSAPWSLADAASSLALPGFFRAIGHIWQAGHASGALYNVSMQVLSMSRSHVDAEDAQKVFLAPQDLNSLNTAKVWIESCLRELQGDLEEQNAAA